MGQRGLTERRSVASSFIIRACNQANTDRARAAKGEVKFLGAKKRSVSSSLDIFPQSGKGKPITCKSLLSNSERRPTSDSDTPQSSNKAM